MNAPLPKTAVEGEFKLLRVADLIRSKTNPRTHFDETALAELAKSIAKQGVIQPILVRPLGDKIEIVAGERRWRASQLAKKDTIPAIVRVLTDKEALQIQAIENAQREDLSPL